MLRLIEHGLEEDLCMDKSAVIALIVLFLGGGMATAQDALLVGQPMEREIAAGVSHSYLIQLNAGDYVAGSLDQRGITVLAVAFLPDGSRLRSFPGPPKGTRPIAFIADTAGEYRLQLTSPTTADTANSQGDSTGPGHYELRISHKLSLDERLKPTQDQFSGSAIEALRAQIAKGDNNTDEFWRQAAEKGTPLVEPMRNDERYSLLTFLWRGRQDTRNVAVIGTFMKAPLAEIMTRLEGTDIWYLTVRVPSGARFSYLLSPNAPLIFDGPRAAEQMATLQADPLNPHRWLCGPDPGIFECQSMVELPGAAPQPWIESKSNSQEGKLQQQRFKSALLGNERDVWVYAPRSYRPDGPAHALLVVFDALSYLNVVPTPVILDNLIAASKIPSTVAVLVGNVDRSRELPPNAKFADFLAKELLPWVHAHYNVTNDPKLTVVAGSSYGGIAATYAGLRHSEVFGNILCQSGSFSWAPDHVSGPGVDATTETGWLAKEFIKSPRLPLTFYMDAGVFEVDRFASGGAILEPSRHMRDLLLAKGYEVHYQQFVGGHDYLSWRGTFADGLIALIGTK
jgi:enterochelin esterase-like enzyme